MTEERPPIPENVDDSTYVQMFYKAYHKLLYREVRKYLDSSEDVDDIVQDSVSSSLRIWVQFGAFHLGGRFPML